MKPLDHENAFLHRQAEVAQAISGRPELKVSIGLNRIHDEPLALRESIIIGRPLADSSEKIAAHLRGQVDMAALAMKHHSAETHQRHRPQEPQAAATFDALEQTRIEALGAMDYPGIRGNIAARHNTIFALSGYERDDRPHDNALADVVAMIAREAMLGEAPPAAIERLVTTMRPWVENAAQKHVAKLGAAITNQEAFARVTQEILADLKLITHRPGNERNASEAQENAQELTGHYDDERDAQSAEQVMESIASAGDSKDGEGETRESTAPTDIDADLESEQEVSNKKPRGALNRGNIEEIGGGEYRAYTTKFDEIIAADALISSEELEQLFNQLMQKVRQYHTVTSRLATRLQRLLLAQQTRRWHYELEDGMIDNARLARIVVRPETTTIYKVEQDTDFRDTVVTLLIDNSGSMRGRPITIAALSADILARTLERCGVKVEILGFTTRDWKGGNARKLWLEENRPLAPGRLNDIRHIIYKSADQRLNRARHNLGLMLKDGILKENIDGEAVRWAYQRLKARREQRKILMVISDGAPVDDATLSANSGGYLDQHLRAVIHDIEREGAVELLAIGIGHDVTRYYSRAVTLHDVEQLGDAMLEQITGLFTREDPRQKRKAKRQKMAS
jgi:cobaltochelatase CobT